MSQWDKVHKQRRAEQRKLEEMKDAAFQMCANFALIGCEFLEIRHYKTKGLTNFGKFIAEKLRYTDEENEQYFVETEKKFRDKYGVDVLEIISMEIKSDSTTRTCMCGKEIHVKEYKYCPYCGRWLKER